LRGRRRRRRRRRGRKRRGNNITISQPPHLFSELLLSQPILQR